MHKSDAALMSTGYIAYRMKTSIFTDQKKIYAFIFSINTFTKFIFTTFVSIRFIIVFYSHVHY